VEIRARHADAVPWPLALRGRRPGDRFRPDGGRGSKKLKEWLIDRKVPREERDDLVVLAAGGSIVAVPALGAVAAGFGPSGAGLFVSLST
jgi:tRNA(Ile)-lysidine synthase